MIDLVQSDSERDVGGAQVTPVLDIRNSGASEVWSNADVEILFEICDTSEVTNFADVWKITF